MTKRELERLSDLLAKFSESLNPGEGELRDQIGYVRHMVEASLEGEAGQG